MENKADTNQVINAGDAVCIENTSSEATSISIICSDCCRVDLELSPGQDLEFTAGNSDAKVVVHHADPTNILIVEPESPS